MPGVFVWEKATDRLRRISEFEKDGELQIVELRRRCELGELACAECKGPTFPRVLVDGQDHFVCNDKRCAERRTGWQMGMTAAHRVAQQQIKDAIEARQQGARVVLEKPELTPEGARRRADVFVQLPADRVCVEVQRSSLGVGETQHRVEDWGDADAVLEWVFLAKDGGDPVVGSRAKVAANVGWVVEQRGYAWFLAGLSESPMLVLGVHPQLARALSYGRQKPKGDRVCFIQAWPLEEIWIDGAGISPGGWRARATKALRAQRATVQGWIEKSQAVPGRQETAPAPITPSPQLSDGAELKAAKARLSKLQTRLAELRRAELLASEDVRKVEDDGRPPAWRRKKRELYDADLASKKQKRAAAKAAISEVHRAAGAALGGVEVLEAEQRDARRAAAAARAEELDRLRAADVRRFVSAGRPGSSHGDGRNARLEEWIAYYDRWLKRFAPASSSA